MILVPTDEVLAEALARLLRPRPAGEKRLIERVPNPYASTSGSEIVTYSFGTGTNIQLLCKYGTASSTDPYGQRGGLEYEGLVYRHLLRRFAGPPRFYGSVSLDRRTECLVFEQLIESERITNLPPDVMMPKAAAWIGEFHGALEASDGYELPFLKRYDRAYYEGWVERARVLAPHTSDSLSRVFDAFSANIELLIEGTFTVVHGEYYPKNVLVQWGRIRPVDWESAAIAAGEIDLAALTEGWPDETVAACEAAYRHARWPGGAPERFDDTLSAARMYLHLRWLGDRPEWNNDTGASRRWVALRSLANRLNTVGRT